MTTTYVECPQCGKRALSVATRCPQCGFQFPPRPLNRPSDRPSLGLTGTALAVGGAILAMVLLSVMVRRGPAPAGGTSATPARPDSTLSLQAPAAPAPASAEVADSAAPSPAAPAPRLPAGPSVRRYAQTWVNVRGDRTRAAPAVGMLNPGDPVVVDSLVRGWYRVLKDGQAMGYVHRSTLAATRPE